MEGRSIGNILPELLKHWIQSVAVTTSNNSAPPPCFDSCWTLNPCFKMRILLSDAHLACFYYDILQVQFAMKNYTVLL